MIYTLRHFDTPLLRFSADSGAEVNIQILWYMVVYCSCAAISSERFTSCRKRFSRKVRK